MLAIKVIIVILFATTDYGQSFPVNNKKLPSTYYAEECPPGFLPCIPEKDKNVPGPVRGSNPSTASADTTSTNATLAPTPTPSRPSSHSATDQQTTSTAPPGENMAGTWDFTGSELQHRGHECPPGIWVC
ncbi:hypothetical protein OS493_033766 [Desmophyllum pertusum]|uniref:Uncharacterized protein n=1 Tax=Desmophyllum pertusum TaxID=174260 RepID=A0A9X0CUZ7_9CNID|nr:hypothetical protein OS493_033766 [Desmophyllum pertusum]